MALDTRLEKVLDALHLPAATPLVALGVVAPDRRGAPTAVCGMAPVALLGEFIRRWRLPG